MSGTRAASRSNANQPAERRAPAPEWVPDDDRRRVGDARGRRGRRRQERQGRDRHGRHGDRGRRARGRVFSRLGRQLWKVDAETATFCGRARSPDLQRHSELPLAHEPGRRARDDLRRRPERQHDGASTRRAATCAGSRSSTRTRTRSSRPRRSSAATVSTSRLVERTASRGRARLCLLHLPRQHESRSTFGPDDRLADASCCPTTAACRADSPAARSSTRPRSIVENGLRLRRGRPALHAAGERHRLPGGRAGWLGRGLLPRRRLLQLGDRLRSPHRQAALVVPRRRARRTAARVRRGPPSWCPAVGEQLQRLGLRRAGRERLPRAHQRTLARCRRHRPEERRLLGARCPHRKAAVEPARRPRRRSRRHPVGHRGSTASEFTRRSGTTRRRPYTLPSGETITGGSWAALIRQPAGSSGRPPDPVRARPISRRSPSPTASSTPARWRTPATRCTPSTPPPARSSGALPPAARSSRAPPSCAAPCLGIRLRPNRRRGHDAPICFRVGDIHRVVSLTGQVFLGAIERDEHQPERGDPARSLALVGASSSDTTVIEGDRLTKAIVVRGIGRYVSVGHWSSTAG